jgi:hypothetical protein
VATDNLVKEPPANLSRFEQLVARWTIVQGASALMACIVASVAMVASWRQAVLNSEQIELNNTLLRARLYGQSVTHSTEIYKILIDKPKLRKYIYNGQDIDEKHPDYEEFAGLADTILDVFDMTLIYRDLKDSRGRSAWPDQAGWRTWMVDVISTSPGLRRYFVASKEYYVDNPTLLALFEEGERKAKLKGEQRK